MPHEPRIPGLRRVLHNPASRIERDVDDELVFHIESRARELVASGQSAVAARRNAEAEFGDLRASRRELAAVDRRRRRRERVAGVFDAIAHDVRHAVKSLRHSPAFAVAAVLTLTIGIGASATIFAVVNGVLLRPLPFGNPERLVGAWHDLPPISAWCINHRAPATYFTYRQLAHTIEGIGVYREGEVNVADPGGVGEPERLASARISATLLPVLQVAPILGHAFSETDDRPGASAGAAHRRGPAGASHFGGDRGQSWAARSRCTA